MKFELQEAPKENILRTYTQDLKDAYNYIKSNRDLSTIIKGVV